MKNLFILMLFLISSVAIKAQVTMKQIGNTNSNIQQRLTKSANQRITLPKINSTALLEEDKNDNSGLPPRFGKAIDVNISLDAGTWEKLPNGRLWSLVIESTGALSINLIFDKFKLAEGAELYMFNKEHDIVFGPITSNQNNEKNVFSTDIIKGSSVTLQLFEPNEIHEKNILNIDKVIHGYKQIGTYSGFGNSAPCHNDINCTQGNNLQEESDAVALILLDDGQRHCSAVLLNNVCQDFTPYILTAFHCLDIDPFNNNLSQAERNAVQNWVFRFQYKSPTCNGSDGIQFYSFSGAEFRSASLNTDFVLLELFERPQLNTGITYAGWSRTNLGATSSVGIHHPKGDVMKISTENNNATPITWLGGNQDHWRVTFDDGTVEPGSSGSALFDQNGRVVGQLHGNQNNICAGTNNNNCFCTQDRVGEYGRFDVSWNGGGTNQTRLSNWLDPNNTGAMTTNTISLPSVTGPSYVCTTNSTFNLNPPPGSTVTWSRSSNLTLVSSDESYATVRAANTLVGGNGWVRATINGVCGSLNVQENFLVGKANINSVSFSNGIGGQGYFCSSHYNNTYQIYPKISGVTHQIRIKKYPNLNIVYQPTQNYSGDQGTLNYTPSPGFYLFEVRRNNACGQSGWFGFEVEFVDCTIGGGGGSGENVYIAYPNPSVKSFTIQEKSMMVNNTITGQKREYKFFDFNSHLINEGFIYDGKAIISVSNLKKGKYILKIYGLKEEETHYIIVE